MKKSKMIVALLLALMMVLTGVLAACKDVHEHTFEKAWTSNETYHWHKADCGDNVTSDRGAHTWNGDVCSVCGRDRSYDNYRQYVLADLASAKTAIGSVNATIDAAVTAAYNDGIDAIQSANSVSAIQSAFNTAKAAMANCVPYANGVYDFTNASLEQQGQILGALENFAVRTGLTGVTLFNEGGYVKYSPRVVLGTENYIPGYGFGTLEAGSLSEAMSADAEPVEAWRWYYHSASSNDPGTANYLNDQGSQSADLYGYIAASYYTIFMNATRDGYEWQPELAAGDLIAVDPDANGMSTTWRFQLRKGLKYSTLSTLRSEYNDREVALEDYITPYKLLLNQANGYFRGSEMVGNSTDKSSITGVASYYAATASAAKGIPADTDELKFSDMVGIRVEEDGNGDWWFEFDLVGKANSFFAKYYISSSLTMPIPADFIEDVGVDNYLRFNSSKAESPVDNSLALGAYVLERWDSNQQIVYKKNPNYVYADTKYQIAGVHMNIVPGAAEDEEAIWNEFEKGKLDAAGIPSTQFAAHKNDDGVRTTIGANFKLNMNALDEQTWEYMFGTNGIITQTPANKYWDVKPAMSNAHFRTALSYALDRVNFADTLNCTAAVDYFDPEYLYDPQNGISYNDTSYHAGTLQSLIAGTDGYGYSKQLAQEYFRIALQELEAAGKITPGTASNPTVITIEIAWMFSYMEGTYHNFVKQCWEDTFNDVAVTGGLYELNVEFWVGASWDNVYYDKMMLGQFDVAFGSISGNTYEPLNYLEVLSSNQVISGGFTLNWAVDTNNPDADILVYNGLRWSFDALQQATQKEVKVNNGALVNYVAPGHGQFELAEDRGSLTAELSIAVADGVTITDIDFVLFGIYYIDEAPGYDYAEWSIADYLVGDPVLNNGVLTYTLEIDIEDLNFFAYSMADDLMIDVYVSYVSTDGAAEEDMFLTSFYIKPVDIFGFAEIDEDASSDDEIVVSMTIVLIDGISIDDLYFTFEGYTEGLTPGWVELDDYEVEDLGDGVYVITFTISVAALEESEISGEMIPYRGDYLDLAGYQSINVYFVLDEGTEELEWEDYVEWLVSYVSVVLVEAAPAEDAAD